MKWILAVLFSAMFAYIPARAECPCSQGGPCQCGTTCDCAVSGKGLVLIAAAPHGSFFGRSAGGSCANGQCTVPTLTATATATPIAAGFGPQPATTYYAASTCASGSCGQQMQSVRQESRMGLFERIQENRAMRRQRR